MKLISFRLAIHVMTQIEQRGLQKQWTWEPMMGESLILALVDNNDVRLLPLCFIILLVASNCLVLLITLLIIGRASSWESYLGTFIPSTGFDFWASISVLECIFTHCCFSGSKICSATGKTSDSPCLWHLSSFWTLELKHESKFEIRLVGVRLSVSCSYWRNTSRNNLVIFKICFSRTRTRAVFHCIKEP